MNEETNTKNPYSQRDIPLHPELVRTLGFVKYVKLVEKQGHETVFHQLPKFGNRYFKNVGRWFNDSNLEKLGIKTPNRRIFSIHSDIPWRHI